MPLMAVVARSRARVRIETPAAIREAQPRLNVTRIALAGATVPHVSSRGVDPLRSSLRRAEAELEGAPIDALASMLAAWRTKPARELADAIDLLSDRMTATLPAIGRTEAEWLAVAKRGREADMPRLAARLGQGTLQVRAGRLAVLSHRPRDPRLTRPVVAIVQAGGALASNLATFPIWSRVFEALTTLADVRARAPLLACQARLPKGKTTRFDRMFAGGIESALRAIPDPPPALDDEERAALDALTEAIARAPHTCFEDAAKAMADEDRAKEAAKSDVSEDDLLAAIHAEPDADAPRHVYADWLLERDDPRGTFIALQLRASSATGGGDTLRAEAEARELLARYERVWLGPAAAFVVPNKTGFRRGFLSRAVLRFPPPDQAAKRARAVSLSTWRTLEVAEGDILPILTPENLALRRLTVNAGQIASVLEAPHRTHVEELWVVGASPDAPTTERILAAPGESLVHTLRRVTLILSGDGEAYTTERLRWLLDHPRVFAGVEELRLRPTQTLRPFALASWMAWFGKPGVTLRELHLLDGSLPHMTLRRRVVEASAGEEGIRRRRMALEVEIALVKGTDEDMLMGLLDRASQESTTTWTLVVRPSSEARKKHAALHERLVARLPRFVHAPLRG